MKARDGNFPFHTFLSFANHASLNRKSFRESVEMKLIWSLDFFLLENFPALEVLKI